MVLRLAVQGFDATALEFFHQPDRATLTEAKRALIALGAMSSDGNVTKIGRRMARFSVSCEFARMLIEAERLGVVEQVATVAACLEAGEIRAKGNEWRSLTQERTSDLLAVLDVFNAARNMKGNGRSKGDMLRDAGVFAKDFFRATEIRGKLLDAVRGEVRGEAKRFGSREDERKAIVRACVAGLVDHLYHRTSYGYRNGTSTDRELARESVVAGSPEWLVGLPKDIEIMNRKGRKVTLHLVSMATAVDPVILTEVAPQLSETKRGLSPRYEAEKDLVTSVTQTFFNGTMVHEERVEDLEHPQASQLFAEYLAAEMLG